MSKFQYFFVIKKLWCSALVIQSIKIGTDERDVIEINPNLVGDVIKLFDGDFVKIAGYLQAQDDRVVLLNPRL